MLSMISGFILWIFYDLIWPEAVLPSVFPATFLSFAVLLVFSFILPNRAEKTEPLPEQFPVGADNEIS